MLRTTVKSVIEREVIKNLLSAHKRIAESGAAGDIIRISRFMLWLAKKRGDVLIEIVTERNE